MQNIYILLQNSAFGTDPNCYTLLKKRNGASVITMERDRRRYGENLSRASQESTYQYNFISAPGRTNVTSNVLITESELLHFDQKGQFTKNGRNNS